MRLTYKKITQPYAVEAFYLASNQDEYIVDDIIAGCTCLFPCNWGSIPASHEERGYYLDGQLWFFSATSRKELGNKTTGTRWIKAHELFRNPDRWQLRLSPMMDTDDLEIEIARANSLLGRTYDFIGVVLDFLRPGILWAQRKTIYCSKACEYLRSGFFRRISPRRSWKKVVSQNYIKISVHSALSLQ